MAIQGPTLKPFKLEPQGGNWEEASQKGAHASCMHLFFLLSQDAKHH